jgi:hypothetical protein
MKRLIELISDLFDIKCSKTQAWIQIGLKMKEDRNVGGDSSRQQIKASYAEKAEPNNL